MFCRCPNGFGGGENTQTCPVCLALPGRAAGAEPGRARVDAQARARARLRDPGTRRLRPEELLLPRFAEGLSDLTIRSTVLHKRQDASPKRGRRPRGRDRPRAPRGGRGQDDPRRRPHRAGSAARSTRSSTSTASARRSSRSSPAPDIHSSEDARRFLQLLRQTIVELGISDAEMEKGTLRVDANVSVRPAGSDGAAHALRAQEHELVPLRRPGDRRRGGAPDRDLRGGRRGRPGDVRLRRCHRRP